MIQRVKTLFIAFVDRVLLKMERRNAYLRKESLEQKKQEILLRFQSVGTGTTLNGDSWNFRMPKNIVLGNNVHIDDNAYFHGEGGLLIGDNTHISRNVTIYTVNHDYHGEALPYDYTKKPKSVTIGKNVWIGMNVSIIPGITIGEGAIIGLGTVVTSNIAAFEIVGNPKNVSLGFRDKAHYERLEAIRSYGGTSGLLLASKKVEAFLPTYAENKNRPIIFVLGTGRSGSTSIVDMLNQHPSCKAFHENIRQFIRISTEIARDPDNKVHYLEEINTLFTIKTWNAGTDQILIHSDQRLWNLIPYLKTYFPNSKFIHLVRNPQDCIKSMIARGWYAPQEYPTVNDHDWAKYRIQGDEVGAMPAEVWNAMDATQKCVWYWTYLNSEIQKALGELPAGQHITLSLERLKNDMSLVCDFIGIPNIHFKEHISNKRPQVHNKNYEELLLDNVDEKINIELKKYNF